MNAQSARKPGLFQATVAALVIALVVLITVVLPAEYDLDPLGTGALLGLSGLSRTDPSEVTLQQGSLRADRVRFELAPFESVEYKYRMGAGGIVLYAWSASGELVFDFHAEPDGAEPGFAESFAQGRDTARQGSYLAPFPGIHGWFWENRGMETVVVELISTGFYDHAVEFRDGDQIRRSPAEAAALLPEPR
jgi:hypothetical protein